MLAGSRPTRYCTNFSGILLPKGSFLMRRMNSKNPGKQSGDDERSWVGILHPGLCLGGRDRHRDRGPCNQPWSAWGVGGWRTGGARVYVRRSWCPEHPVLYQRQARGRWCAIVAWPELGEGRWAVTPLISGTNG
jgi:hypothetical protein